MILPTRPLSQSAVPLQNAGSLAAWSTEAGGWREPRPGLCRSVKCPPRLAVSTSSWVVWASGSMRHRQPPDCQGHPATMLQGTPSGHCRHWAKRPHARGGDPANTHLRVRGSLNSAPVRCWGSKSHSQFRGFRPVKPPAQPTLGTDRYCISSQCADCYSELGSRWRS